MFNQSYGWLVVFVILLFGWKPIFQIAEPLGELPATLLGYVWVLAVAAGGIAVLGPDVSTILGPFRWNHIVIGTVIGVLLFVIGGAGYYLTQQMAGAVSPTDVGFPRPASSLNWAMLVGTLLVTIIAEELAFRGVLLRQLAPRLGILATGFVTALLFSLYHVSVFQLLSTFCYGVVLAALVFWLGSLWPALVAHLVLNSIGIALFTFGATPPG